MSSQLSGPPPPWDALEESLGILKGVRDGDKLDIYDPDAGGARVGTQDYFTSMRRWALGWPRTPLPRLVANGNATPQIQRARHAWTTCRPKRRSCAVSLPSPTDDSYGVIRSRAYVGAVCV